MDTFTKGHKMPDSNKVVYSLIFYVSGKETEVKHSLLKEIYSFFTLPC